MSKRQAGKGDDPRNLGPRFRENYPEIDWHRGNQQAPDRVTSTKKTFVYGQKDPSRVEHKLFVSMGTNYDDMQPCPNPGCNNGGVDSGGVTPWGAGITLPCPDCGGTGAVPK